MTVDQYIDQSDWNQRSRQKSRMDEPTTGLHVDDIKKLLAMLQKLVTNGNSVVVVEHNLDVIKCADWIIDLGPEGGAAGGQIVAEGRPEQVAKVAASHTGRFLAPLLADEQVPHHPL
jgi:excinuclease ABC subunit A